MSRDGWHGHLRLAYTRDDAARTVVHDRHDGPLRVLASLYPEGPGICHNVLVHPPGGLVGGDTLDIDIDVAAGAHALVTTPGATRFYRSAGAPAQQVLHAAVGAEARLEWLPLETIAYAGCAARNTLHFGLAPGAEMIGWDVLALGLPAAGQAFDRGAVQQRIEIEGRWIDAGRIAGDDTRLRGSPLGMAGHGVLATLWFGAGSAIADPRREALIDSARSVAEPDVIAGTTAPDDGLVVLRALAARVEPAMRLINAVRARWRPLAWALAATPPRVWRT